MGNRIAVSFSTLSNTFTSYWYGRQRRVLIAGLDSAGKTTLLYRIKHGKVMLASPTAEFNEESVAYKGTTFTIRDVGGQAAVRQLWRYHVEHTDALIFVVDSTDAKRFDEARAALDQLYTYEKLQDAKLLVLASKQDVPGALSAEEVRVRMDVEGVTSNPVCVLEYSAISGKGLDEGLEWLSHGAMAGK